MNKYIVIQTANAQVRLKSASSRTGYYQMKFGDRVCKMSHFIESWFATTLCSYLGKREVSSWLRDAYPDIGPDEIDLFIDVFKAEHPHQAVEYNYDMVPVVATENTYCEMNLGMFKNPIKLTLKQEMELLDIIKTDHEKRTKYSRMVSWFTIFCNEYGYESKFKRDRGDEADEMAWFFCMYHGLSVNVLKRAPKPPVPKQETRVKSVLSLLFIYFLGGLYISVAFSLMLWSSHMENFMLSIVPCIVGWSMIGMPIYFFFRNEK